MTELGGTGPVGGASFDITANTSQFDAAIGRSAERLQQFGRTFQQLTSGLVIPVNVDTKAEKQLDDVGKKVSRIDQMLEQVQKRGALFGSSGKERDNQFLNAIEKRINEFERRRITIQLDIAAEEELQNLRRQLEQLQRSLGVIRDPSFVGRTQQELKTIAPEKFKEASRAQIEMQRTQLGLIASSGKLSRAFEELEAKGGRFGGLFGRVGRVLGAAEQQLDNFGLSVSDVSILLGAGFAGGVAGLVQVGLKFAQVVGQMALAVGKFLFNAAQLGATVLSFREKTLIAFGEAGRDVTEFAQTSAEALGLSERAALEHIGTVANLFKSFGVGEQASVDMSLALARSAEIIHRTSFTTDTYDQVLQKLRGSLTGNVEALREYGIAVNEQTLKQTGLAHGINLVGGELDAASKALLAQLFIIDQAQAKLDDFTKTNESQATAQERLAAAWTNFQTTLGIELAPLLLEATKAGEGFVEWLSDAFVATRDFFEENEELVDTFKTLVDLSWDTLVEGLTAAATAIDVLAGAAELALEDLAPIIDLVEGIIKIHTEAGSTLDRLFGFSPSEAESNTQKALDQFDRALDMTTKEGEKFDEIRNKLFAQFEQGTITAEQFLTKLAEEAGVSVEHMKKAYLDFFDVLVEERPELKKYRDELAGVKAEEIDLSEAEKKTEEELRKLNAERAKSPEHIEKVVEAYKGLQEALEDAAEAESDAREALAEARKDAAKQITDAEESLAEAREDSAERIADAQEALADAEVDAAERVRDAEEALEEAREDARERILDAEEKLRETREDAAEKVSDAEEKLAETREDNTRRIQDAEQRLHDARIQQAQQIGDAQRSLEEARRSGDLLAQNRAAIELDRAKKSNTVRDAERGLVDARREAIEKLKDAEEALNDARIEAAEAVADAEEALADTIEEAHERIRDSEEALADAREEAIERVQEAHERLVEAQEDGLERVTEAEERLRDVRVEAAERIRDAEEKLAEVLENNTERIEEARDKVAELEGEFVDNTTRVKELNAELEKTKRIIAEIQGEMTTASLTGLPTVPFFPPGLHEGGFAAAHRSYWVGEKGPELWVGSTDGTVVSNEVLRIFHQMFKRGFPIGSPGGGSTFQIFESVDPRTTAFEISRMMAQQVNN